MSALVYDPVQIARQFLYVREAQSLGQNRGLRVEAIQHWSGGAIADSWCAEAVWLWLDIAYQGHPPFDRMQSTEAIRAMAQDRGWITDVPLVGDIYLFVNEHGRAHHVGLIVGLLDGAGNKQLYGIAGNTSKDGKSSNGDGVYEHALTYPRLVFVSYPRSS